MTTTHASFLGSGAEPGRVLALSLDDDLELQPRGGIR